MNVSASYYDWWFRYGYSEDNSRSKKGRQASLVNWIQSRTQKQVKHGRMPAILWEGWVVWWDGRQEKIEIEHTGKMDTIISWVYDTIERIRKSGGTLLDWGWYMF